MILYDFFDCSDASAGQWKILANLVYETIKVPILADELVDMDDLQLKDEENLEEFKKRVKEFE